MNRPILIVEDSDEDFEATTWALHKVGFNRPIDRCTSVQDALERLSARRGANDPGSAAMPCLVLLDLNLPGMDGRQFLERLRAQENPPAVPVVVLSTSSNPVDVEASYRLGAAGYLNKPLTLELLVEHMQALSAYWFEVVLRPEEPA